MEHNIVPLPDVIYNPRFSNVSHPFYHRDKIRLQQYQQKNQHQQNGYMNYNQQNQYQQQQYHQQPQYYQQYYHHHNHQQQYYNNNNDDYNQYEDDYEDDYENEQQQQQQDNEYYDENNPENNIQYVLSDEAIEMFAKTEMKRRALKQSTKNKENKLILDEIFNPAEQSPLDRK